PLLTQNSKPAIKARPVILPSASPEPEPKTESKTMLLADAAPEPDKTSETSDTPPAPAPKAKANRPIITRARRYDRDILLTDPHLEAGTMNKDSTAFSDRDFKFSELPDEL